MKEEIEKIIKTHNTAGFNVTHIVADMQFECTQDEFDGIEVDIIDVDDYVEKI